ncbi:MAG: hypothetical protein CL555_17575 [Algoriphagus sp.]|nr:hypothetical protein [Algoriphagus sp.]
MKIIEFKIDRNNLIQAGLQNSGTIQFILSCFYSDAGEIFKSQIQIAGYSGELKYKFNNEIYEGLSPIEIGLSSKKSLQLPEGTIPKKAKMPDNVKLEIFYKLRKELEEAGLI